MKNTQLEKDKIIIVGDRKSPALDVAPSIRLLNDGMLSLIDLGEFAKVFSLSRKYKFFNTHGALIYALVSLGNYALAVEAINDLLNGPLKNHESSAKIHAQNLLAAIYFLSPASFDDETIGLVRNIDKEKNNFKDIQLTKLAILLHSAIARQWPINDSVFGNLNYTNEVKADEKFFKKTESKAKIHQSIFQQALANIESHIDGESYPQYRHQLLKTDFNYIRQSLSREAVRELAIRCGLYDFHPWVAWDYFAAHQYQEALDVLTELILSSDLLKKQDDFYFERLKDLVRKMYISSIANLIKEERDQYAVIIKSNSPLYYHQAIAYACQNGQCSLELPNQNEVDELLAQLEKSRIFLAEDVILQ